MMQIDESLRLWNRYGQYVLMATAHHDQVIKEAHGCNIVDVDGNALIDLEAGQICSIVGHNHPKLIRRIVEQCESAIHVGTAFVSLPVFQAAEKLARITPGDLKKTLFLSTGAEANECAFRIAKAYTGRRGIVGFDRGYSGLSLATMSAGINSQDASLAVAGTLKMLTPDCQHCPVRSHFPSCDFQCLLTSERFLNAHCSGGIAAIVVEPILSSGGMIFPPDGYFKVLRQLADRLGALLISDEAQTGMGRTGRWFGIEHDNVVPDILVFSKGAGGGFPVAGVVVSDELANSVIGRFSNFSSHQSDPLAAAALSAVIDIIEEEGLIGRAQGSGSRLADGLRVVAEKHEILSNVRSRGLMIGIDVNSVPARGWSREQTGRVFEYHCRAAGVHVKSIFNGATFRILPPLTISNTEIDRILEVFEEVSRRMRSSDNLASPKGSRNPFTKKLEEARAETLTLKKALSKAWEMSPARWYERLQRTLQR